MVIKGASAWTVVVQQPKVAQATVVTVIGSLGWDGIMKIINIDYPGATIMSCIKTSDCVSQ